MSTRAANFHDFTGKRFGRWTVLRFHRTERRTRQGRRTYYVCRCDCGTERVVLGSNLIDGLSKSCGCLRRERHLAKITTHGGTGTKEWRAWRNMIQRCYNPRATRFCNHGGRPDRPIRVCDRWLQSFQNFLADMGPAPTPTHSIERRDNNGDYTTDNCYWATTAEQSRNKRNNVMLTHNGRTMCLQDWADELGIRQDILVKRLKKGLSVDEALTTPVRTGRMLTHDGLTMSVADWAQKIGRSQRVLRKRLKRMSVHDALTKPWGRWASL